MTTSRGRPVKRLAALGLSLVLLTLLIVGLVRGTVDAKVAGLMILGMIVGASFALRGELPSSLYTSTESRWDLLGLKLTEDNDPRNISPRIYLPILLTLIALGAAALAVALSR